MKGSRTELAVFFTLGFLAALFTLALLGQAFHASTLEGLAGGGEGKQYCVLGVQAVFSPDSEQKFVGIVSGAQDKLDIMLYQFSNPALKDALASAVKRGVRVRVLLEPRIDSNYATAEFLAASGIQVRWASKEYTNTHSKTAVIDGRRVLVGSTNWSGQAMRSNRESSVLIESESLAGEFERVFEEDWAKGKEFVQGAFNAPQ